MFIGSVIYGVISTLGGGKAPTSAPPPSAVPMATTQVEAEALAAEFSGNELSASGKYKGKMIAVRGMVDKIGRTAFGKPFVTLRNRDDGSIAVEASFSESKAPMLSNVRPGTIVIITGKCHDNSLGIVGMDDCDVTDDKQPTVTASAQPSSTSSSATTPTAHGADDLSELARKAAKAGDHLRAAELYGTASEEAEAKNDSKLAAKLAQMAAEERRMNAGQP